MIRIVLPASLLILATGTGALAAPACATKEQATAVRELYASGPQLPTFMAADKLRLSEAAVASALPRDLAVGVPGSEFGKVWTSLTAWDKSTTVVRQGGHVFEVMGRIPPGKPSDRPGSKNFNLDPNTGLTGHLRPDLVSAIYAVRLTGPEGPVRGVVFLDGAGQGVFGVYTGEGRNQSAALTAQFEQTWKLMESLPGACP